MSLFCKNKDLSPLQRRSLAGFAGVMAVAAFLTLELHDAMKHLHLSRPSIYVLAVLAAVPAGAMIFIVGRYLRLETDEFVRALVVQSMLWGFGATMMIDTVYSYLGEFAGFGRMNGTLQMLNIDVFCVTAGFAMVLLRRRYQ